MDTILYKVVHIGLPLPYMEDMNYEASCMECMRGMENMLYVQLLLQLLTLLKLMVDEFGK